MDTSLKVLFSAIVTASLVMSFVLATRPVQVTVQTDGQKLGSVASPDILSPYFSFGGVRHWAGRTDALTQATTTVCSIQSPAGTSTLIFASIKFDVSSTSASTVTMAKSIIGNVATTSLLGTASIAANGQGTVIATTSGSGADGNNVFPPNARFNVSMSGGTGTFSPSGTCQAVWIEN